MIKVIGIIGLFSALLTQNANAFTSNGSFGVLRAVSVQNPSQKVTAPRMSSFDESFLQETPDQTRQRIQDLVDENPVLLFMKGSKLFPQCGFSSTAVQILNTFGINFHSGK